MYIMCTIFSSRTATAMICANQYNWWRQIQGGSLLEEVAANNMCGWGRLRVCGAILNFVGVVGGDNYLWMLKILLIDMNGICIFIFICTCKLTYRNKHKGSQSKWILHDDIHRCASSTTAGDYIHTFSSIFYERVVVF